MSNSSVISITGLKLEHVLRIPSPLGSPSTPPLVSHRKRRAPAPPHHPLLLGKLREIKPAKLAILILLIYYCLMKMAAALFKPTLKLIFCSKKLALPELTLPKQMKGIFKQITPLTGRSQTKCLRIAHWLPSGTQALDQEPRAGTASRQPTVTAGSPLLQQEMKAALTQGCSCPHFIAS